MKALPRCLYCLVTSLVWLGFAAGDSAAQDRTSELQQLVQRVARNLELREVSLRSTKADADARYDALAEAIAAWNNSPKTDADAEAMHAWLVNAVRASQLGARQSMPATPTFSVAPEPIAMPQPQKSPVAPKAQRPAQSPRSTGPATAATRLPRTNRSPDAPRVVTARPRRPTASPQPSVTPQRTAKRPAMAPVVKAEWSDHPAAAEMDWADPFAEDAPARDADAPATRAQQVSRSQRVSLNIEHLTSQVNGYNARLQDLEGVLVGSQNLTAFRLAALLRDLDDLCEKRGFLRLYLDGLTAQETVDTPRLESPNALVQMLQSAIDTRTADLEGARGSQSDAEQAILGSLDRKLASLRGSIENQ